MASTTTAGGALQRQAQNVRLHAAAAPAASRLPSLRRLTAAPLRSGGGGGSSVAAAAGVRLAGVGSSVPEKFLTNDDLAQLVDTNDEWITTRTGIKKRHILAQGETLGQHAVVASQKALDMAGVAAADVDLIVLATSSPDDAFGSATTVQARAGSRRQRKLARRPSFLHRHPCPLCQCAASAAPGTARCTRLARCMNG